VTNAGTQTNCAGGATAWGTWVTCEETRSTDHGYCFDVMWDDPENALSKTPITAMGFFSHESIDVDPRTGVAYLTEDDFRGSIPADPNTEVDGNPAFRSSFLYVFARNAHPDMNEFAGPTFAPDENTFFVNVQDPGTTFAIWGPFARQSRARQQRMAFAPPPSRYAPAISGELADAARRHGLGPLEAAALDRVGVALL
jgi:secreted PhoX family phosphatase